MVTLHPFIFIAGFAVCSAAFIWMAKGKGKNGGLRSSISTVSLAESPSSRPYLDVGSASHIEELSTKMDASLDGKVVFAVESTARDSSLLERIRTERVPLSPATGSARERETWSGTGLPADHFSLRPENEVETFAGQVQDAVIAAMRSREEFAHEFVTSTGVMLALGPGIRTPVTVGMDADAKGELSDEQAHAKERIADDFRGKIAEASAKLSADAAGIEELWLAEQARADERYRLLFGDAQYQAQIIRAAQESLSNR